ncbi:EndoU domain-containing protein [Aquimarina mytili]|uniref:EndoU domain-containing protein n=1 Tax=Aquimarina mytili TaxID=874423 RepID=A0A936ZW07_9FLAO|nr:EndoU domain-containing protein [Aquimarina mytili]MBL0683256.1 EndoU domain-containing protein [Aquimarina mytili]
MLKKVTFYFLHILFLFSLTVNAQVFPVNVTPQIIPPYSLKLSEYGSSASEKLLLNLLLTDITESNRQVRLKFYLENNAGLSVQSSDVVIGANPIFLDGGVPLRLSNIDLRPYFELQNLRGINPLQYSVPLKEGLYRFCFEVYDALSNRQISRKSCATVYLVLNDPPFLNTPKRGEQVLVRNPQNIVFDWTPRHLNATNVQYEFTISELWDTQMDPQAGFLASRPLYQTTTRATTLLYGPAEPQLLPDKMYGWRVRAVVNDGISETSVFKNDGFSEINHFTYTADCAEPAYVLAEGKNPTTEKILWQGVDHIRYNVEYRKKDAESSIWFEGGTINEYTSIYNLEPGTTYEFRVGGQCLDNGPYTYSQIYEFTTTLADDEESTYNCGITPEIVINNQDPLEFMGANETFTAGDFPVTVREINGSDGTFSGWGFIVVPYLQDTKIMVSFDNVKINTDYQLIDGIVVTDYDEDWGGMGSVNEIGELFEGDNDIKEIDLDFDITIDDITVNEDGSITVTHPVSGVTTDYPAGDDVVIRDRNNDGSSDTFHIDEEGNIREGGPMAEGGGVTPENTPGVDKDGNVEQLTAKGIKVTFEDDSSYAYGFDELPSGLENDLGKYYEIINDADGKPYNIINKAVANGGADILKGKIEISDSNISADRLVVKTSNGELLKSEISGNTISIDLKGYYSFEHENIYVTLQPEENSEEKQSIAGVFSLWHLSKKDVNVTIIPVQGVSISESQIRSEVNNIFGKASVNVNLTIANEFTVDPSVYGGDNILMGESGVFANYTNEQQAIIRSYKSSTSTSLESYYLFVFGNNIRPSRDGVAGFMPIKRQFGFIFSGNVSKEEEGKSNISATIAHELGHGVFGLEHPFSELGTSIGATDWLMDYGNGIQLSHLDWAQIHNPDFKLYLFQDDEEGEYGTYQFLVGLDVVPGEFKSHLANFEGESISFISSAGKIISLPSNAQDVTFKKNGALLAFTVPENGVLERYASGKWNTTEEDFAGYLKETSNTKKWKDVVYRDNFSRNLPQQVTVYLGKFKKEGNICGINLYSRSFGNTADKNDWNSGGNKTPLSNTDFVANSQLFKENVPSPEACDLCPKGEKFYNTYNHLVKNDNDDANLRAISKYSCSSKSGVDYSVLVAQIQDDSDKELKNIFWLSDKALYKKARDAFWDQDNALALYLEAIKKVDNKIDAYGNQLNTESSEENLYAAIYYLNEEFIKTLSIDERIKILSAIFEHNLFITDDFLSSGKSDVSMIKKMLTSLSKEDLTLLLTEVINNKELFKNDNRDVLFEIAYALTDADLKSLHVRSKLRMLEVLLNKRLYNMFGNNEDAIVAKIVKSVKDEEATEFFKHLESTELYSIDEDPLLYHLKEKLSDFLNTDDSYTVFFNEIKRLSDAKNRLANGNLDVKTSIIWDVKQKDYVIVSFVIDNNDFTYHYNSKNHTVGIKTCDSYDLVLVEKTGTYRKVCNKERQLLPNGSSPFDLVGITVLNDVSPFASACKDGEGERELCGKMIVVPAIFIDYLEQKKYEQQWSNFGWNTFNIIITVATFGEGAAAITAIRGASAGTKLAMAGKHWYTLLDFTYTVTDLGLKVANVNMPKEWGYVGYLFAAKTSYDLINKGGAKGLAYLKKASKRERREILEELDVKKDGKPLTDDEIVDYISDVEKKIKDPKTNPDVKKEYEDALKALDNVGDTQAKVLSKIDDFAVSNKSFKDWVKSLDNNPDLLKNLDELGDDLEKFAKDFDFTNAGKVAKFVAEPNLAKAWKILRNHRDIRRLDGNIEVLAKISDRFEYAGKSGFNGLEEIFNGGSKVKSIQNFINGLNKVDEIFESSLPLKFSGIKAGEVKVVRALDGKSEEVARIVKDKLEMKKFLEDGTPVGKPVDGHDILKSGDEVGFKPVNKGLDFSQMDVPGAIKHVKYRDLSDLARRDIVGCHDINEFNKLRQVNAVNNANYNVAAGKKLDEVEEVIIMAEKSHSVPGVKAIEYRVPSTDGRLVENVNGVNVNKGYTTGNTKGKSSTKHFEKTLYDPSVWTDAKLEKAIKEAVQDAANKNGGTVPTKFNGNTTEGYEIEGWFRNGVIETFYFK